MTALPSPAPPPPPPARSRRRYFIVAILLVVTFLAGYVPQWIAARNLRTQLETVELQLRLSDAHRLLGVASQEAQRNNYASAAQAASQFFDQCSTLVSMGTLDEEPRTRVALLSFAGQRDAVMALLSAADPAARERLAGMFLTMNGVLARRGSASFSPRSSRRV